MTIHQYLKERARGARPQWLADHRRGDRFDREAFVGSRMVFYPCTSFR
jgi:hypothetical protein